MAVNIGEWWQDVLKQDEIEKTQAAEEARAVRELQNIKESNLPAYKKMELANALNNRIMAMSQSLMTTARNAMSTTTSGGLPKEYNELLGLLRVGGGYGEGARAEVRRGANQAVAAGQVGLTGTGMSSGTNVAGLTARAAADEAIGMKKVEDTRIGMLGGALQGAGQARLQSQSLAQQKQASILSSLTALKPSFVNY